MTQPKTLLRSFFINGAVTEHKTDLEKEKVLAFLRGTKGEGIAMIPVLSEDNAAKSQTMIISFRTLMFMDVFEIDASPLVKPPSGIVVPNLKITQQ